MHWQILVMFIVILAIAGCLAGYSAGLFGIGGGIVLVPTFATLFPYFNTAPAVVMHVAIGSALALIMPAGFMSARKHKRLGNLDFKYFKSWIPSIIIGIIIATVIIQYINTSLLVILFTAYLYICILFAVFKKDSAGLHQDGPQGIIKNSAAVIIGGCSTLLGIGGGTFTVPFLMMFDYPLKKAIGLSSAVTFIIGIGGTIGVIIDGLGKAGLPWGSIGYVSLPAFIIIVPFVMFTSPLGAATASKLDKQKLKWIYIAFLAVIAVYMTTKMF